TQAPYSLPQGGPHQLGLIRLNQAHGLRRAEPLEFEGSKVGCELVGQLVHCAGLLVQLVDVARLHASILGGDTPAAVIASTFACPSWSHNSRVTNWRTANTRPSSIRAVTCTTMPAGGNGPSNPQKDGLLASADWIPVTVQFCLGIISSGALGWT